MPKSLLQTVGAVSVAGAMGLAPMLAAGRKPPASSILAGPPFITDEEKAIVADPNAGAEHAVILVEETEQDDSALQPLTRYHLRAKILSSEGRDLANVEIPLLHPGGHILQWWGRTILPDGGVIEIPQELLKEQTVIKSGRWEYHSLNAALAGVEPGCVIDYGYTYRDTKVRSLIRLPLERPWPVRRLRFRWTPVEAWTPASTVRRESTLAVNVIRDGKSFFADAANLLPVAMEPDMPADYEVHSAVTFYYVFIPSKDADDFWKAVGLRIENTARIFNSYLPPLDDAIGKMKLPPDAGLATKLQSAYDWMAANVKDVSLRTAEELEIERKERAPGSARPEACSERARAIPCRSA